MKKHTLMAAMLCITPLLALLPGCEGESPTKAIPRTEERMSDYALTQVYMVPIASGQSFDAASFKSQIDPLMEQYGEEEVIGNIRDIANNHSDPQYRIAAVFSIRPYVSNSEFNALADEALTDAERQQLDQLMR